MGTFLVCSRTSIGQIYTHKSQSIHSSSMIFIEDSLTSMQSGGHTVTHAAQKSHLFSLIVIIINRHCRKMNIKSMPIIIFAKIIYDYHWYHQ